MARTLEEILKLQLGNMCFQNAALVAENESLKEEVAKLAPTPKKEVAENGSGKASRSGE
jgi:regulator of replication initiation timing